VIKEIIAKFGENTLIGRFVRYKIDNSHLDSYIHLNGKIGVMVEVSSDADEKIKSQEMKSLARDLALQIAASKPKYLKRDEVPTTVLDYEKEILKSQALQEGKPEKVIEKMVDGRINKFYAEVCLMEQPFIKDPDKKISDVIKESSSKLGNISVKRFVRYQVGENI
jgi:elongation factor Ts